MNLRAPRLAAVLLVVLLPACGGCGGDNASAPRPALPKSLANDLAARSAGIAETFAAGDVCAAAKQADGLQVETIAAINAGRVPPAFQETLSATVNDLVNRINCSEPAPEAPAGDCDELEEQRDALREETDDAEGKGKQKKLEDQLAEVEARLADCRGNDGEGGGEGDDD